MAVAAVIGEMDDFAQQLERQGFATKIGFRGNAFDDIRFQTGAADKVLAGAADDENLNAFFVVQPAFAEQGAYLRLLGRYGCRIDRIEFKIVAHRLYSFGVTQR